MTLDEQISNARSELYTANLAVRDASRTALDLSRKLDALLWQREAERENRTGS